MAKSKKQKASPDTSRWFNQMLFTSLVDGGEIEIKIINPDRIRRYYVNDLTAFETVVTSNPDSNVYYGVAMRKEPLKKDSQKDNVLGTDLLWAEVDTDKIGWDAEAVFKRVHKLPPSLRPTACIHSGYGLHFYWRLSEALYDVAQIEQVNQVLRELVSGDSVWDCTRILRIPGSTNNKYGKSKPCRIVWCYPWQRKDVHALVDKAIKHDVLWNDEWITAAERDDRIAAQRKDVETNAYQYANEDKRKTTNARGLKVWDRCSYHGGPGSYGVDEAIMLFTAYQYCVLSGKAKMAGKKSLDGMAMNGIVALTLSEVEKIKHRDAPHEHWDMQAERDEIEKKLYRWAKKWDGGLREKSEQEYKEKTDRAKAGRIHDLRKNA
jgi:hypothetical protein